MAIFNSHFYHSMTKRYTVAMGTLFSDMSVVRYNEDGSENHRITVPITYSNKEKFVQRLISDSDHSRKEAITVPRMAFELVSMNYDGQRKLQKLNKYQFDRSAGNASNVYTPVPYDLVYNLYIVTKTQEEMLQIVEQIVPAFTPDFTVSIKSVEEPELRFDLPITLLDVLPSDSSEGMFEDRRQIMWTMSFLAKAVYFGPVAKREIILHPQSDLYGWEKLYEFYP